MVVFNQTKKELILKQKKDYVSIPAFYNNVL